MEVNALNHAARIDPSTLSLERVASSTQLTQQQKINEVSRAFEAVLLRQILQESQRPMFKSKYVGDSTTDGIYRDQVVSQLADSISKSGHLGLGKSLARDLQRRGASPKAGPATAAHTAQTPAPTQAPLAKGSTRLHGPTGTPHLQAPKYD